MLFAPLIMFRFYPVALKMSTDFFDIVDHHPVIVGSPDRLLELALRALREVVEDVGLKDLLNLQGSDGMDSEKLHDLLGVDVHIVSLCFHY